MVAIARAHFVMPIIICNEMRKWRQFGKGVVRIKCQATGSEHTCYDRFKGQLRIPVLYAWHFDDSLVELDADGLAFVSVALLLHRRIIMTLLCGQKRIVPQRSTFQKVEKIYFLPTISITTLRWRFSLPSATKSKVPMKRYLRIVPMFLGSRNESTKGTVPMVQSQQRSQGNICKRNDW